MTDPSNSDPLNFEHAEVAPEKAQMACANCSRAIESTYYGWNTAYVCPSCHEQLSKQHQKPGSFFLALLFGAGAAVAGALLYYGIAALTNMEFGLIAIVVGIAVGKAVRAGAGAEAKKRYRALAIILTYMSITATYVPSVLEGSEGGSVLFAAIFSLVLPFLMIAQFENIMGLVILAIGIYEAWKLSAPPQISVQGPFTLESAPAPFEPVAVTAPTS
jgi:hypothetical protein